jgi:hypothetical protein
MAHGAPDYSNVRVLKDVYRVDDLAELAARVNRLVAYDRRGCFIYYDDFGQGLAGIEQGVVYAGSNIILSALRAESPPFSVGLLAPTPTAQWVYVCKRLALTAGLQIGAHVAIRCSQYTSKFVVELLCYKDGVQQRIALTFDLVNRDLLLDVGEGQIKLMDGILELLGSDYYFAHIKIVADFDGGKGKRILFDNHEFDISAYTTLQTATALANHLQVYVANYGSTYANNYIYVDDLIVTTNEP